MHATYLHDGDDEDFMLTSLLCPANGEQSNIGECDGLGFEECRCYSQRKAGAICNTGK